MVSYSSFCTILLTNKQTKSNENITSSAKVTNKKMNDMEATNTTEHGSNNKQYSKNVVLQQL